MNNTTLTHRPSYPYPLVTLARPLVITLLCLSTYLFTTTIDIAHARSSYRSRPTTTQPTQPAYAVTLEKMWEHALPGRTFAGAASNSKQVFAVTEKGWLEAFDSQTGQHQWEIALNHTVKQAPIATETQLFVGTEEGTVTAFDTATGKQRWAQQLEPQAIQGLSLDTTTLAAVQAHGQVTLFDLKTGISQWQYHLKAPVKAPALLTATQVITTTMEGSVTALDKKNGTLIWTTPIDGPIFAQGSQWQNTLLLPSATGALYALDKTTGQFLWSYTERKGKPIMGAPAVIDGTIVVGSIANSLGLVNGKLGFRTGETRINGGSQTAMISAGPVGILQTATGKVIAVNKKGEIQAQLALNHVLKAPASIQSTPHTSTVGPSQINPSQTASSNKKSTVHHLFTTGQAGSLTAIALTVTPQAPKTMASPKSRRARYR